MVTSNDVWQGVVAASSTTWKYTPSEMKTLMLFIVFEAQWTFALLMSHLLFWVYSFPAFMQYSYLDISSDTGEIVSGPSGSGTFPIGLMLMSVSSILYAKKWVEYDPKEAFLLQFPAGPDGEPLVPRERLHELEVFKDD